MPSPFISYNPGQTSGAQAFPLPSQFGQTERQALPSEEDQERQRALMELLKPSPEGAEVDIPLTEQVSMRSRPPANENDFARRKQIFRGLFDRLAQDPDAQQALLAAAAQILQPVDPRSGENSLSRLVQGALVGSTTYQDLQAQGREEERAERQLDLREEAGERAEAGLDIRREQLDLARDESERAETRLQADLERTQMLNLKTLAEIQASGEEVTGLEAYIATIRDDDSLSDKIKDRAIALAKAGEINEAQEVIASEEPSTRDEKISAAMERLRRLQPNASDEDLRQRATQIVDKGLDIVVSETADSAVVIDRDRAVMGESGAFRFLTPTQAPGSRTEGQDEGETSEEDIVPYQSTVVASAAEGTGLISGIRAFLATFPGREDVLGIRLTEGEKEVIDARQTIKNFNQEFIRARALSERYATTEQERLIKENSLTPKIKDNPSALRQRARTLDQVLESVISRARKDLREGVFSQKERNELRKSIRSAERARGLLGVQATERLIDNLTVDMINKMDPEAAKDLLEVAKDFGLLPEGF